MAGMMPPIAISGMDLFIFELYAAAPVKHVAQARCSLDPDPFYFLSPSGLKKLIQIKRNTNINVTRDKSKSGVASKIKTPRFNAYLRNERTALTGKRNSIVRASCVCNEDEVCVFC
jgi:hypothetical protein